MQKNCSFQRVFKNGNKVTSRKYETVVSLGSSSLSSNIRQRISSESEGVGQSSNVHYMHDCRTARRPEALMGTWFRNTTGTCSALGRRRVWWWQFAPAWIIQSHHLSSNSTTTTSAYLYVTSTFTSNKQPVAGRTFAVICQKQKLQYPNGQRTPGLCTNVVRTYTKLDQGGVGRGRVYLLPADGAHPVSDQTTTDLRMQSYGCFALCCEL